MILNEYAIRSLISDARRMEMLYLYENIHNQGGEYIFPKTDRPSAAFRYNGKVLFLTVLVISFRPFEEELYFIVDGPDGAEWQFSEDEIMTEEMLELGKRIPDQPLNVNADYELWDTFKGKHSVKDTVIVIDPETESIRGDIQTLSGTEAWLQLKEMQKEMTATGRTVEQIVTDRLIQLGLDLPF